MFCCHAFENLISNAGERGLAVLVCKTDAGFKFAVQARAVSFADESNVAKPSCVTMPTHVTLSESMRIRYCPSCGRKLAELVGIDPSQFEVLATTHRPFQNNWGIV